VVIVGLVLALGSALGTNVAFLYKHRGAVAAPPVDARHPVRTARALFASRWWTIGWLVAAGAWVLHVGALALASLSVVQAVLSGGLVFLAVLAERFFGFRLGRRQWVGLMITAAGLAVIGATTREHADTQPSLTRLIALECACLLAGGLLVALAINLQRIGRQARVAAVLSATRVEAICRREGIVLATAAGGLFGVSDIAIKYVTTTVGDAPLDTVAPWGVAALIASVVSFYASARSQQLGPAHAVITITSVAANLVAILGGILVFHDPLGTGALEIAGRLAAFCLVIGGAALMPAPVRARRHHGGHVHDRAGRAVE
jgi:drug/metabolite transporter (DMT)-like permease